MPAIRKIRIVNFRFNDGSKLIPDEIFCMENAEGKPIDTLLNLDNGGGKSVLVQLMLQAVCPKAKVQNRNISSYFQKGTDHAFVLIEWSLDGSSNSLLTGIALAAGTNTDDESESKTVRFYTFLHNYPKTGDKLDLINLPLTERTGNHIRPLSFDELRKLLQNKRIEYFPSDSLRRYQKRLEEYGILHTEWENILVRINAVEGGIIKFFDEYKTSDRLLDRFIIPGVMPDDNTSSEELEEMFLNYAKSYADQEKNLILQSRINGFTAKLQEMLPLIKIMWNAEDTRIQAIHLLANHLFTIEHHIRQNAEKKAQLEETIRILNEKLRHIQTEKASEAYYIAKDEHDKTNVQFAEITLKRDNAKNRHDNYEHKVNVLNAAKEYADLTAQRGQLNALYKQLRELDGGNMDTHMLSLSYSLYHKAMELEKDADKKYRQEMEQYHRYTDTLQMIQQKISELQGKLSQKNDNLNKAAGSRDLLTEQIEKGLRSLDVRITIMLDGHYSEEDISNIRIDLDDRLSEADNTLEAYENEERQLESELTDQDTKRNELIQKKAEINADLQNQKKSLEEYKRAYDAAVKVTEHLSLPAERLFTEEPLSQINRIIGGLREQLSQLERKAIMLSEQLMCIQNGQLHLSKSAVDFLQETGISFQTGESYLLNQQVKIRETILEVNPLAAYAVIVDSGKVREKIMRQTVDTWFSAIVPIYTRSELADMAEKKWNDNANFLSAYENDYFSDKNAYSEHIQTQLSDVQTEIQNIKHQIGEWEKEQNILTGFKYSADDEQNMRGKIDSCNEELTEAQNVLTALDNRKNEIGRRKEELKKLRSEQQDKRYSIEQDKNKFRNICENIGDHERICAEITGYESECRQLSDSIEKARSENEETESLRKDCEINTGELKKHLTEYRDLIEELKDTREAALIPDDYQTMLSEYTSLKAQYSSDRKDLQNKIEYVKGRIINIETELTRFHIEPEEYENTEYSYSAFQNADESRKQAENEYNLACDEYAKAFAAFKAAETKLQQATEELKKLNAELLDRSEVGSDYEHRISECDAALKAAHAEHYDCKLNLDKLMVDKYHAEKYKKRYSEELSAYTPTAANNIENADLIIDQIQQCNDKLICAENEAKQFHTRELEPFRSEHNLFTGTLDGIGAVIGNTQIHGDRYFTLYERTEEDIRRYRERSEQLAIILRDVEDSRIQLVTHCYQITERLYNDLIMLSKKSGVQIGSKKQHMINVVLPQIDLASDLPKERIGQYITDQVKKYLSEQDTSVKKRRSHLEIRRLLNSYIGKESIPIKVFKIDKNPHNSRLRLWEDALTDNSGGEQFVVLFSLIVAVMNFTRSMTESLSHASGVLILDNPFGPISSPHLLEPMFRIAHHFHIQLICFTHLDTAAIKNCFDMAYRLRFRNLPLSNVEILESEPEQQMEHAFYLSEQISLF